MYYFNKQTLGWEDKQNVMQSLVPYSDEEYSALMDSDMLHITKLDEVTALPILVEINDTDKYYVLNEWFNTFGRHYNLFEQQLTRRAFLQKTDAVHDIIFKKDYNNLTELYRQAEWVASEIQRLKKLLGLGVINTVNSI